MNPDIDLIRRELETHAESFKTHPEYKFRRDAAAALPEFIKLINQYQKYKADSEQLHKQIKVLGEFSNGKINPY